MGVGNKFLLALFRHIYSCQILSALGKVILYLLLCHAVDAYLVVKASNSSNFLGGVKLLCGNPSRKFLALLCRSMIKRVYLHESLLVACDVASNGLSEHSGVAINIKEIVLQLERKTYLLAKLIQIVGILGRSIG